MADRPISRSEMTPEQLKQVKKNATAFTEKEGDMADHSEVLNLILKSEGGLNEDEPDHVGGVSYAGITQRTYDEFRQKSVVPFAPESVKGLAGKAVNDPKYKKGSPLNVPAEFGVKLDIINAFYDWYFGKYHTWELPKFLQYIYADFVTNAASASVKIIQRFVGVDDDGLWGSGTSLAVAEWRAKVEAELADDPNVDNNLITEFHEQKLAHYNFLATENPEKFARYLPGWKRRCNHVLSDLGRYFEDDEPTPKAVSEDDPMFQDEISVETESSDKTDFMKSLDIGELLAEIKRRTSG